MSFEEESTQPVSGALQAPINAYLELSVLTPAGAQETLHFYTPAEALTLLPPEFAWTAAVKDRSVVFSGNPAGQVDGREVTEVELQPGECLQLAGFRIWVTDARLPALASLEGSSGEFQGRTWSLRPQPYRVGRRSSGRVNQVELNHPTVSRAHASLLPGNRGEVMLLTETSTSPTMINGKSMPQGELTTLHHGDLLQFGEVSLRFKQSNAESAAGKLLTVYSLGRFEVRWGDLTLSEAQWKSEKARWLLARLAWSWGQPVPAEVLMESLWPELPALRGRKNLSQCLANLRQALGLEGETDEFILRTPSSLQLNPQILAVHDAEQVDSLCRSSEPLAWEKALRLYGGEYLPGCFEDWAVLVRQRLADGALDAAQRLTSTYVEQQNWLAAAASAQRGMELDPCHQDLALALMEALTRSGQAPAAVRCFQQLTRQLKQQLDLEPSTELLKAYQRARMEIP